MWIWPIKYFWNFSPFQWLLALAWNICEYMQYPMPFAPQVFGFIIGAKGKAK